MGGLSGCDTTAAGSEPAGRLHCLGHNKPAEHNPPIGYLFSLPERIRRLQSVLTATHKVDIATLKALQRDTYSEASHRLRDEWVALVKSLGLSESQPKLFSALCDFEGDYAPEDRGPVAFEMLTYHVADTMFAGRSGQDLYRTWNYICERLPGDLRELPKHEARNIMDTALTRAAGDFERFGSWGDMHRLRAGNLLAWLPLLGKQFTYYDVPAGGSRETLMKTNHVLTNQHHYTSYGSQARHISSMEDLDENYFVLIGGNDGWLGSENLADLVPLWLKGEYVRLPLRPESAAARCRYVMTLAPGEPTTTIDRHESAGQH